MSGVERLARIQQVVVTAEQMQAIESRLFAAGIPVAALMEKVAGRIANAICARHPLAGNAQGHCRVGVVVGPGHNGGDALVIARELHFKGYTVACYQPLTTLKPLTASHAQYVASLGIPFVADVNELAACDLIIDGLFGFGLNRALTGAIAHTVDCINTFDADIVSIDLPSGIHTDTGAVLGTAICATHTLCLGLWKRAFLQEQALPNLGQVELIDFDIPWADVTAILGPEPTIARIMTDTALRSLPIPRSLTTHKYKEGHVLLICGSQQYMGAAILTGLAARASGVGLLSMAVPAALKTAIATRIPDAITIACPETESGAIARLPDSVNLAKYQTIACGPGLTLDALPVVQPLLGCNCPLILDADGLNALASLGMEAIASRSQLTVLTPHEGEFKRLFPELASDLGNGGDRLATVQTSAHTSGAMVALKGHRMAIAHPDGRVWINPQSTSALARGGSGDVLTGLMGGLLAQAIARQIPPEPMVATAAWWHAQAGREAASQRTELGVDAETLVTYLNAAIQPSRL